MARKIFNSTAMFRDKFVIPDKTVLQWYPGHMKSGLDRIQATLKDVDAVVEVHDARIPFSGRHPQLSQVLQLRPHLMILNKADLADLSQKGKILAKLSREGINNVRFLNCGHKGISRTMEKQVFPKLFMEIDSNPRYKADLLGEYHVMVIGVPNVGKSTFLNKVRQTFTKKGKGARVGAMPGVTRSVMNRVRVSFNPSVYVIDTPGILNPKISDVPTGMRLALCGCLPEHLVGPDLIVDYLLFWLNSRNNFHYVDVYGLKEPTDNVNDFLAHVAVNRKMLMPVKNEDGSLQGYKPNFRDTAVSVIRDFQTGQFGKVFFDDDKLDNLSTLR